MSSAAVRGEFIDSTGAAFLRLTVVFRSVLVPLWAALGAVGDVGAEQPRKNLAADPGPRAASGEAQSARARPVLTGTGEALT